MSIYPPAGTIGAPAAPSNLTATPVNSIRLDWQDNSNNEDGFIIETTQDTLSGNWTLVDTVAADVITYIHTGLTNGVTYYYRVKAYNGAGASPWSDIAGATDGATSVQSIGNNNNALDVYFNSANKVVTVANTPIGSSVSITDITGKTVYNSVASNEQTVINTVSFVNGIYILRIENEGAVANRKLIIYR